MTGSGRDHPLAHCSVEGCEAWFRDSGYWAHIKAQNLGWFFMKDETKYCPDHVPDWVPAWRLKHGQAVTVQDKIVKILEAERNPKKAASKIYSQLIRGFIEGEDSADRS